MIKRALFVSKGRKNNSRSARITAVLMVAVFIITPYVGMIPSDAFQPDASQHDAEQKNDRFEEGYFEYTILDESKHTVSVKNLYLPEGTETIEILANVEHEGINYIVVSIDDYGFIRCRNLKTLMIPPTVKSIGDCAFHSLRNLKTVELGDGVETIGYQAFWECGMETVMLPSSVKSIGDCAFGHNSLIRFEVDAGNNYFESVEGVLLDKDRKKIICYPSKLPIVIPGGVTTLGAYSFDGCIKLEKLIIPEGITKVEKNAFNECSSLSSVTTPNSLTVLGDGMFNKCSSLKEISIPDVVTDIGEGTFSGCAAIESISIPNGITVLKDGVFSGCSSLEEVSIPDGVTELGVSAFEGCESLSSVTIPNGMKVLKDKVFCGCSSLKEVSIPDGVTEIGVSAFEECILLSVMIMLNGVTVIKESTFSGCLSLTELIVPDTVESIEINAFSGCRSLLSITIPAGIKIDNGAFGELKFFDEEGSEIEVSELSGYSYLGILGEFTRRSLFNVFFDENGGSDIINYRHVSDGTKFTVPDGPGMKPGLGFVGWSYNGEIYAPGTKLIKTEGGMRFVAVWAVAHNLTFDANGGVVDCTTQNVFYDYAYGELPTPTKDGYTFVGWYTAAEGGTLVEETTKCTIDGDHTLYAHWEKISSPSSGDDYTMLIVGCVIGAIVAIGAGALIYYITTKH